MLHSIEDDKPIEDMSDENESRTGNREEKGLNDDSENERNTERQNPDRC